MGKLEIKDGRHIFHGGFSTQNPEDIEQLKGLIVKQKPIGKPRKPKKEKEEPKEQVRKTAKKGEKKKKK